VPLPWRQEETSPTAEESSPDDFSHSQHKNNGHLNEVAVVLSLLSGLDFRAAYLCNKALSRAAALNPKSDT
jgi:hypothetical protein